MLGPIESIVCFEKVHIIQSIRVISVKDKLIFRYLMLTHSGNELII